MKALLVLVGVIVAGAAVVLAALADGASLAQASPTGFALAQVPADYLGLDQAAAISCPGLSWTLLAAIASVESDFGRSTLPGVSSGANPYGAEGPMQFEPATFAAYDHPVPADPAPTPGATGAPSPYVATDAIWAAARMLCANGVAADPAGAVFAYNHSSAYVSEVLHLASAFAATAPGTASAAGAQAASWARSQVGRPYVWGGASPQAGFDCSGLVLWAYARAGVNLPRTAQAQFDATVALGPGAVPVQGDLVFFGSSVTDVTHVGIYIGGADMVDAPHTGARVRVEPYHWSDLLGIREVVGK
ncbi:MAG: NlpC/P60 family protein [Acidimicrobiales bacterium]